MEQGIINKFKDVRVNHRDAVYFYGDLKTKECYIEENQCLPKELSGKNKDILVALYNGLYIAPEDMGKMVNLYERMVQGCREDIHMDELETHIHMEDCNGEIKLYHLVVFLEKDENGLIVAYVGKIREMRTHELDEREILSQFSNEQNPAVFIRRVARFQAEHPDRKYAYIQFDVRKFRYINEIYGVDAGDRILQYISDTLKVLCDDNHLYSRMAGDLYEIVTYYNSREELLDFIELLDSRLHRCGDIRFSMSFGVKIVDGTDIRYRKSGDEAGLAREHAKNIVHEKVAFFEESLLEKVVKSGAVEEIEDEALQNHEFEVYLQPKYSYDGEEATMIGAEALVRWIDSEGHMKPPAEFVPVFEENGFLLELDQFMWEEVCKIIDRWRREGRRLIPISVNVSRSYLNRSNVVEYIQELIKKYEIPQNLLQIEITETAENEETIQNAKDFKDAGFTLLMDDFGSGYSSLCMLKDTPFDVLKMDRMFLDACMESDHGKKIVSHVIAMGNDIGLDIVAEGVETKEMADFLHERGCNVSQGFYFSRPIPVEEFEVLLDQKK